MEGSTATFNAELKIFCNNRRGLVVDISREFTERSIDINFLNARKDKKGHLIVEVTFDVHTKNDINVMIQKIRQISDVIDIERTVG